MHREKERVASLIRGRRSLQKTGRGLKKAATVFRRSPLLGVDAFLRLQLYIDDISSDYFLPVFRFRIIEVIRDVELVVFQH